MATATRITVVAIIAPKATVSRVAESARVAIAVSTTIGDTTTRVCGGHCKLHAVACEVACSVYASVCLAWIRHLAANTIRTAHFCVNLAVLAAVGFAPID